MRVLILSDIHGNLEALTAVLEAAGPCDALWNLGDLVGYGASPNQVIDIIRPLAHINVRGNHDRACSGIGSTLNFNPVARAAAIWTLAELTPPNLAWLRAVPIGPVTPDQPAEPPITCAHGSPLNEDSYILSMRDAWAPLRQMPSAITLIGHTHIQGGFSQKEHDWHELRPHYATRIGHESWTLDLPTGTRHLINPGSVGQPRDCDWRAAFAIFTPQPEPQPHPQNGPDPQPAQITFHRVPYDLARAQGRILMAGLPERLAARLREGR